MRRFIPILALLLPIMAASAGAQPAPADADRRAAALAVIEQTGMRGTLIATLQALREPLVAELAARGVGAPERIAVLVDEILMPGMLESAPDMLAGVADIWARNFSVEELAAIAEFYRTPAGRKSLELTPKLVLETNAMVQGVVPRVMEQVIARNRETLRARGLNL